MFFTCFLNRENIVHRNVKTNLWLYDGAARITGPRVSDQRLIDATGQFGAKLTGLTALPDTLKVQ